MNLSVMKNGLAACILTGIAFSLPGLALAAPDLMVYPTRVVMTDRERTAQVDIINTSQMNASYKISLVRKRMTDTGNFEDVVTPEPAEKFTDELVKFSPRQVTLLPGAGQTIRMMFKMPGTLEEGEYRSHLVFTKMVAGISDLSEKDAADPGTVSMRVKANIGVSIPVIARHGKLEAQAAIDPLSVKLTTVEPKQQLVGFTLTRSGTRSVYGDVVVYRGEEKVAVGNGFAIYTPNLKRKVGVPVKENFLLKSGENIRVVFTERDEKKPMAETTITIP
jgi:P pilus assembly chaperone PapD